MITFRPMNEAINKAFVQARDYADKKGYVKGAIIKTPDGSYYKLTSTSLTMCEPFWKIKICSFMLAGRGYRKLKTGKWSTNIRRIDSEDMHKSRVIKSNDA